MGSHAEGKSPWTLYRRGISHLYATAFRHWGHHVFGLSIHLSFHPSVHPPVCPSVPLTIAQMVDQPTDFLSSLDFTWIKEPLKIMVRKHQHPYEALAAKNTWAHTQYNCSWYILSIGPVSHRNITLIGNNIINEITFWKKELVGEVLTGGKHWYMIVGLRPALEGFVVTMHEGACETGSQIPTA